jgi:hypothetical protein
MEPEFWLERWQNKQARPAELLRVAYYACVPVQQLQEISFASSCVWKVSECTTCFCLCNASWI